MIVAYLTVDDLLELTGAHGDVVADLGLLSSATAPPSTFVGGRDAYPPSTVVQPAAQAWLPS